MRLWLVTLLLGLAPAEANAASCPDITTTPFHINFLGKTENFVSSLETHDFEMVVVGVVNGILVSPVIGAPPACADMLSACIQGRSPTQLSAMVASIFGKRRASGTRALENRSSTSSSGPAFRRIGPE